MPVLLKRLPLGLAVTIGGHGRELLLLRLVLADAEVVDGAMLARCGILDKRGDSDGSPATASEDLPALAAALLALCALVAQKVEDVD